MKSLTTFILLLISIHSTYSQSKEFNREFSFKDGIYLSFEQLLKNSPEFIMSSKLNDYILRNQVHPDIAKQLSIKDSIGNKVKLDVGNIWSICIGGIPMKLMAIRETVRGGEPYQNFQTNAQYRLVRFNAIGKITAYRKSNSDYIINSDNRKQSFQLSVKSLGQMIIDDQELYLSFKKDRKKKNNLFLYISQYNQRNPIFVDY